MKVLLLGGTDLTRAVGDRLCELGMPPVGVAHIPGTFSISYRKEGMLNARFSDMAAWCAERGIVGHEYDGVEGLGAFVEHLGAQFCLAAGWYYLIPQSIRSRFSKGCAGLHASLLPKFRGGSPMNWALLTGQRQTGISLFELTEGLDDGPLYGQRVFEIPTDAYVDDLISLTQAATLDLISECMPGIADGSLQPTPQVGEPSYCLQRVPEDGLIDWSLPVGDVIRLVRAVSRPYPGAFTHLGTDRVLIWRASPLKDVPEIIGVPGQIGRLPGAGGPIVVARDGAVEIEEATWLDGRNCMERLRRSVNQRFRPDVLGADEFGATGDGSRSVDRREVI